MKMPRLWKHADKSSSHSLLCPPALSPPWGSPKRARAQHCHLKCKLFTPKSLPFSSNLSEEVGEIFQNGEKQPELIIIRLAIDGSGRVTERCLPVP